MWMPCSMYTHYDLSRNCAFWKLPGPLQLCSLTHKTQKGPLKDHSGCIHFPQLYMQGKSSKLWGQLVCAFMWNLKWLIKCLPKWNYFFPFCKWHWMMVGTNSFKKVPFNSGLNVCKTKLLNWLWPGGALVFGGGYHPRKRTFKTHPKQVFPSMKVDPYFAFLHVFP